MSGGGVSQSPDQNRCFSEAYVDTVGVEALADAIPAEDVADTPGITPDEIGVVMTPEQRDAFYVGLQRCIDVKGFFVGVFTTGVQMAEADVACLTGALDDGATKLMAVAAFDGDPAPIENDQGFIDLIARLTAACPAAMEAAGWDAVALGGRLLRPRPSIVRRLARPAGAGRAIPSQVEHGHGGRRPLDRQVGAARVEEQHALVVCSMGRCVPPNATTWTSARNRRCRSLASGSSGKASSSPTTIFLSGWARLKARPTVVPPDEITRTGSPADAAPPSAHGT